MKHIIIGTAGHIDHGKTTLIRALTGRNTDRLREEQERGISIELGFTYFDLPSGKRAGIIDVPGHEKFIKNMIAGAIGIDIVIFVIAADEGVMPQTKEHLAILDILGIKKGFIALTKQDLVDEEWQELVTEDIGNAVKGTFLEGTEIIPVSSTKGIGLDKVVEKIDKLADEVEERDNTDMPRLPVDRIFSISGFGTIVTGTLISGTFKVGEEIQVFPGNKVGRIRSLQVHDLDASIVYAGQRVAVNIAGLKKSEIVRGDVIGPIGSMQETSMLDVKLRLLKDIPKIIENRARLRLYIGTKEVLCRVVLLDRENLSPGENCYAQLRLEESIVAKRGDKFILRFYSPMFTIGGGEILESNPSKKKRYDEKVLEELSIKEKGESKEVLEKIIKDRSSEFPSAKELSVITVMPQEKVIEEIKKLEKDNKVLAFQQGKELFVVHVDYYQLLKNSIINELKNYHMKKPLKPGISKEELRSKYLNKIKPKLSDSFINYLISEKIIEQNGESICLKGYEVKYNEMQEKIRHEILKIYLEEGFTPSKKGEIVEKIRYNIDEVEQVFDSLVDNGEIIKLKEDLFIHKDMFLESIEKAKLFVKSNGYITVSDFRDILNTNRKMSMALLEYFDQRKITKRIEDRRVFY